MLSVIRKTYVLRSRFRKLAQGALIASLGLPALLAQQAAQPAARPAAQQQGQAGFRRIGTPHLDLGAGPFIYDTAEQHRIKVSVVARGIPHPWSVVFLPNGDILVTERSGRIRVVRDGVLDPNPVLGVPTVLATGNAGLFDLALHPKFGENKLLYFTYAKPGAEMGMRALTLARGKYENGKLTEVKDLFSGEMTKISGGSRIAFGRDGLIYMTTGAATAPYLQAAQDPMSDYGKTLRLKEDGTIPSDNPFVGRAGYKPEIMTMGHRDPSGLTIHPQSGAVYGVEHGPNGGDEINLLLPGRNYGWPLISYGRDYTGVKIAASPSREGMEEPLVVWIPSIAPSGLMFYTGDKFPAWKGNAFVGGMQRGEITNTGRLERIAFNDKMEELRRESILTDLQQRIRDVRQGPDGNIYVLTEEQDGALLRIEPVQ
jgi:glucose/arabinose dehydrogenase